MTMNELEKEIVKQVKASIADWISKMLVDQYNSPLRQLVSDVFAEQRSNVEKIMQSVLGEVLNSKEFKVTVKEEFQRKIAKNLVGYLEWTVEKAANELKANPIMKAKMILAIENIINENQSNL